MGLLKDNFFANHLVDGDGLLANATWVLAPPTIMFKIKHLLSYMVVNFGFVVWIPIACYRYSGNPQPTTRTTNLPFLLIAGGCINFFFLHGPGPWSSVQRHANSVAKCWMTVLISPSGRMVAAYWPRRFPIQRPFFWTQVFQRLFFWENKITPGQN